MNLNRLMESFYLFLSVLETVKRLLLVLGDTSVSYGCLEIILFFLRPIDTITFKFFKVGRFMPSASDVL